MLDELKQKWITALRSGDYKQTNGKLSRKDFEGNKSYCCLGVLCDIVNPKDWVEDDGEIAFVQNEEQGVGYPPYSFLLEVGLTNNQKSELVAMNDNYYMTFEEIANAIEHDCYDSYDARNRYHFLES